MVFACLHHCTASDVTVVLHSQLVRAVKPATVSENFKKRRSRVVQQRVDDDHVERLLEQLVERLVISTISSRLLLLLLLGLVIRMLMMVIVVDER